jgi:hypothetical protein
MVLASLRRQGIDAWAPVRSMTRELETKLIVDDSLGSHMKPSSGWQAESLTLIRRYKDS